MEHENASGSVPETRPPTIDDLKIICTKLNNAGVKYILIGGFAINYYGFPRATQDIDFLVDPDEINIKKIKEALLFLPDKAVNDLNIDDVKQYNIVRIADEIVIDLIGEIGDLNYANAEILIGDIDEIKIPIADVNTLMISKQGLREKDRIDLQFLEMLKQDQNE